jgi:hypothetical protein
MEEYGMLMKTSRDIFMKNEQAKYAKVNRKPHNTTLV